MNASVIVRSSGAVNTTRSDVAVIARMSAASLNHCTPSVRPAIAKAPESIPSRRSASRPLAAPSAAVTIPKTSESLATSASILASATVPELMSAPLWT